MQHARQGCSPFSLPGYCKAGTMESDKRLSCGSIALFVSFFGCAGLECKSAVHPCKGSPWVSMTTPAGLALLLAEYQAAFQMASLNSCEGLCGASWILHKRRIISCHCKQVSHGNLDAHQAIRAASSACWSSQLRPGAAA